MGIIKLENVSKSYSASKETFEALKNVNLDIKQGDFIVICGESGAGKSTLLNTIETLSVPTNGKVYIQDKDVTQYTSRERAKLRNRQIGILLQNFPLIEKFDVYDNTKVPFYFSDIGIKEQEERINAILDRLGIIHLKKKPVKKLSGGERQRVAIARALVTDPQIVIADEPTSNLDAGNRDMFMNLMHELNDNGKTIIIASHDKEIIDKATMLITLRGGEIVNEK